MTVPSKASATLIASADLPAAVGPAIRTARVSPAIGCSINFSMTTVLVAIAAPGKGLNDDFAPWLHAKLIAHDASPGDVRWLAPGEALEIPLSSSDTGSLEEEIRVSIPHPAIDIALIPDRHRRKALLIADMDSTIIQQECIDEIAEFAGARAEISAITERAMRGELAFDEAIRERVGMLAGLGEDALQKTFDERIRLTPGARTLTATMKANGAFCALISGGFDFFTRRVAEHAGFTRNEANRLEITDGKLTGRVIDPILGRDAKLAALRRYASEQDLEIDQTLAVGDGANDLAMIKAAGLGVAFHAKPVVAADADARIDHGDLTALLYLQGYARSEFRD